MSKIVEAYLNGATRQTLINLIKHFLKEVPMLNRQLTLGLQDIELNVAKGNIIKREIINDNEVLKIEYFTKKGEKIEFAKIVDSKMKTTEDKVRGEF